MSVFWDEEICVCIVVDKRGEPIRRAIWPVSPYAESVRGNGKSQVAGRFPRFIHCYHDQQKFFSNYLSHP